MATLLLVIIYIAFVSLGLPDSIMGSAWPIIHNELNVPVFMAGPATMIVTCGTVVSSLFSEKMIRRFGTGKVTVVSVALTAAGLLGISSFPSFLWICLMGIPLGIGAGAIDAALNNFVALHYKATHMNWLHCFWGVGATAGPLLMSLFLAKQEGWRQGYFTIGSIQTVLVFLLLFTLPLWKRFEASAKETASEQKKGMKIGTLLKMNGAKPALVAFFCYCGIELTTGLWGSTFLVSTQNISPEKAAQWISMYYFGITLGRCAAGFLAFKLDNVKMMRLGQGICLLGAILLAIPFSVYFQLSGLMLIGLGCAPIFPAMLHETPKRFGKDTSQAIMGIQMACAYIGSTVMPPIFGFIAKATTFKILPFYLLTFIALMLLCSEKINNSKKIKE